MTTVPSPVDSLPSLTSSSTVVPVAPIAGPDGLGTEENASHPEPGLNDQEGAVGDELDDLDRDGSPEVSTTCTAVFPSASTTDLLGWLSLRRDRVTRVDSDLDLQTRTVRFIQAAARNRHDRVTGWLKTGVDVHAREEGALLAAAQAGHAGMVERLLRLGADPWVRNGQALRMAARGGHLDLVMVLLDGMHRTNVHAQRSWPSSEVFPEMAQDRWAEVLRRAAGEAVMQAHRTVLEHLMAAGADITQLPEVITLMAEEATRHCAAHRSALAQGNTVRARMKAFMGPSAYQRHLDLVTWLLHPDRYGPDQDGRLLLLAAQAGHMIWVPAVLRLSINGRIPVAHLDAALLAADAVGAKPVVDFLRPFALQAQQDALREAVNDVRPGADTTPLVGNGVEPVQNMEDPERGWGRRRL